MKRKLMVEGMSCQHCVNAITQELENIGITEVLVDLPTGTVYIDYPENISDLSITQAVDEAGFTLTSMD